MVGGQDSSGKAIALAELYDPITGTFRATGSLQTARLNPTVTLLGNGDVLVAGGYEGTSSGTPLATAEIYDPQSGHFTATGSMGTGRRNATATRLPDGRVLVAGGYNGKAVNSPEVFDPRADSFEPAMAMSTPRRYPTASLLPSGAVLVVGGFATSDGNPLSSSERYVQSGWPWLNNSGRFVQTGSMHTARGRHTASLLGHNSVLIAGGFDGQAPLASAELYTINLQTFSETASLQTARYRHTATLLSDGTVLIAGGADANGALASAELFQPGGRLTGLSTALLAGLGARLV